MAVTPVGNPYVESSDLVANYPGASEALAERIDIVGVNPFADSAARTTAIPSPTEGMMSSLNDTDAVQRYDGATWKPVGGKVLQVVSATKVDTFSTTSTTLVDVTGLSVSITPVATSSRILVSVSLALQSFAGYGQQSWGVILRDSTSLGGTPAGTRSSGNFATNDTLVAPGYSPLAYSTVDSPATISATTYKVQIAARSGTTAGVNITSADSNNVFCPRVASSIIVMEIGA